MDRETVKECRHSFLLRPGQTKGKLSGDDKMLSGKICENKRLKRCKSLNI